MAKILTGPIVSEIRGKIGDVVFARNRGGMFSRRQGIRVQPWSTQQQNVRTYFGQMSAAWNASLTQAQRDGWNALASTLKKNDQLGQAAPPSGQNLFARLGYPMFVYAEAYLWDAPADLSVQDTPNPTISAATASPQLLTVSLDVPTNPATMFIFYATRPRNVGVSYFGHGFTWFDTATDPQTWPFDVTSNYTSVIGNLLAGKKLALLVRCLNLANGALSPGRICTSLIS